MNAGTFAVMEAAVGPLVERNLQAALVCVDGIAPNVARHVTMRPFGAAVEFSRVPADGVAPERLASGRA